MATRASTSPSTSQSILGTCRTLQIVCQVLDGHLFLKFTSSFSTKVASLLARNFLLTEGHEHQEQMIAWPATEEAGGYGYSLGSTQVG